MTAHPIALDVLYNHASRHVSPKYTLEIAKVALAHKQAHSEPIVSIAKNIVTAIQSEARESVVYIHPVLPPEIDFDRFAAVLPMSREWNVAIPQDILDLALHDMILCGKDPMCMDQIIKAGANINAVHSVLYFPPLVLAARKGLVEHVKILLDHGADPNISVDGHTPLRHARLGNYNDIVDLLRDAGAVDV